MQSAPQRAVGFLPLTFPQDVCCYPQAPVLLVSSSRPPPGDTRARERSVTGSELMTKAMCHVTCPLLRPRAWSVA